MGHYEKKVRLKITSITIYIYLEYQVDRARLTKSGTEVQLRPIKDRTLWLVGNSERAFEVAQWDLLHP